MQPCDVIVCGDTGVDYSMDVDTTLGSGAVSRILREMRELGGEAGCRAKFLAERGIQVHLISRAPAPDGNGRFVEKELNACPGILFTALPNPAATPGEATLSGEATLYRVSIATPEAVHRLIYEPTELSPVASDHVRAALQNAVRHSPQAVLACQADWLPYLAPYLRELENPLLTWHLSTVDDEPLDDGAAIGVQLYHAAVLPPDRRWKFTVRFGPDKSSEIRQWNLPDHSVWKVNDVATLDVVYFAGMVQSIRLGLSLEDSLEYAGDMALRQARGEELKEFPPFV